MLIFGLLGAIIKPYPLIHTLSLVYPVGCNPDLPNTKLGESSPSERGKEQGTHNVCKTTPNDPSASAQNLFLDISCNAGFEQK